MAKAAPIVVDLRRWVEDTCALPRNQDKAEVRALAAIVTAGLLVSMAEPLFYLFLVPSSLVSRVAGMAPSVYCVAAAFAVCLLLTLPHLVALLCFPRTLHMAWPRRMAAHGAVGAAVVWLYLASLATPLDLGAVEWAYGLRAMGSLLVGGAYGVSLNAQQLRECINAQTR